MDKRACQVTAHGGGGVSKSGALLNNKHTQILLNFKTANSLLHVSLLPQVLKTLFFLSNKEKFSEKCIGRKRISALK